MPTTEPEVRDTKSFRRDGQVDPVVQPRGQPCPNPGERLCPMGSCRKPELGAQQGGSVLSRGHLFPRSSGSTAARCTLLSGQAQHMHPAIEMELRTEEWHCPSQPLASAGLQMHLHELPLQQEWEKTASDGGCSDNCPPITSNSLQLELLYQAPAHLFFSLFIYMATPWNVHRSKLRHLYYISQVLACSSTYISIQVKVLQDIKNEALMVSSSTYPRHC